MYILDGSSFFISNDLGDVEGDADLGYFFRDTRFLSQCTLRINGQKPILLRSEQVDYFSACFYLGMPADAHFPHPLSILRTRLIGNGVHEEVTIWNFGTEPVELKVALAWDCDFADLFTVRSGKFNASRPSIRPEPETNQLVFEYGFDEQFKRKTVIGCDCECLDIQDRLTILPITIPARGEWKTCFTISPVWDDEIHPPKYSCADFRNARPEMRESLESWLARTPMLKSNSDSLNHTYQQSLIDLAALRFFVDPDGESVIAAGLPWYMALFGRDSLITAYQCCWIAPDVGKAVLRTLAKYQGRENNDFRDEQPGKIMHELRFGELTVLNKFPQSPYYGSVDATPLFLILLHEVFTWTADEALVWELKEPALKALEWIERYGDLDGDGLVEYICRSSKGLDNHCWKDSGNSMLFKDGSLAKPPIATVEVQGYVYDAKLRLAELAENVWQEPALASRLRSDAEALKHRVNEAFWLEQDGGYYALALDGQKRQVDSITSNMGHLLWSGIIEPDKAKKIVEKLMDRGLYSGWGIRTMSSQHAGYNPIEYHNGTVWPHDNSLIVEGLMRYGYAKEAAKIVLDMLEAAQHFDYRLPEAFAGYSRLPFGVPVNYPTACQPQAWATGAPLLFIKALLGLKSKVSKKTLEISSQFPLEILPLNIDNIQGFGRGFRVEISVDEASIEEF
jgi:glycogen debranching enzyme